MPFLPHMVADLCGQAHALEEIRLRNFLDWLQAHHRTPEPLQAQNLNAYLEAWFASLSPAGMVWEVQLLLTEIAWWQNLSQERLCRILKDEAG
jgi:hypothetical protein